MHCSTRKWFFFGWLVVILVSAAACGGDDTEGAASVAILDGATDEPKAPDAGPETSTQDREIGQEASVPDASDAVSPDSSSDGFASSDAPADATSSDAPSDAAPGDAAPTDAGSGDSNRPDGGPTLVQAGAALTIKGVTSDDYVVYYDNLSRSYYALSLQGGAPTLLFALPPGGNSFVNVFGKIVFLQTWGSAPTYVSQLTIWSSALGQPQPVSNSALLQFAQTVFASDDSKSIAYVRVTNDQATIGAIYGLDADGTNSTLLVSNVALQPFACLPRVTFPGGGYAIATYCLGPTSDDAGADAGASDAGAADARPAGPTRAIQAFAIANHWAPTLLVSDSIATFAVDPASDQLVTASSATNGHLQGFSLSAGTAGIVLDPVTTISSRQFLFGGKSSPWYVAYNADTGALKRTAVVAAPSPQTLVPSGANYFLTSSLDGNRLVVANTLNSALFGDLSVVSSQTPGVSQLVATSTQFANRPLAVISRPGGAFSTDQKYVLFFSDAIQNRQGAWIGYVRSMPLDVPDASVDSVRRLSLGYAIDAFNLAGSKVLLVDNYQEGDGGSGTAPTVDLVIVDPSSSDSPKVVASGALGVAGLGGAVSLSNNQSKVVYSTLLGAAPGIYQAPIP